MSDHSPRSPVAGAASAPTPPTDAGSAPTPPTDAGSAPTPPTDAVGPGAARSRRPLVLGVAAGVLVLGGATAAVLGGALGGDPPAPEPDVVVLPSPTPTVAPVARQPVSPFVDALPATVLEFALTSLAEDRPLLLNGAHDAYRLDYSDGGTRTLTVLAAQWPTTEEAAAAYAAAVAAAGPPAQDGQPTTGDVVAGGSVTGAWTVTAPGDGTGTVTWSNGTAVLQLTGPADLVRDLYAAYPY
jgi:hypothetical protein